MSVFSEGLAEKRARVNDRQGIREQPAGAADPLEDRAKVSEAGIKSKPARSRCSLSSWELAALITVVVAGDIVGGPT
jgi:hypothetical protein